MDLSPTLISGDVAPQAESSPAETASETSQETTSASSGETKTTQAASDEQGAKAEEATEETAAGDTGEEAKSEDTTRFDQHPRWKQMLTQRNEAKKAAEALAVEKARLEGRLEALERSFQQQPQQRQESTPDFDAQMADLANKLNDGDIGMAEFLQKQNALNAAKMDALIQGKLSEVESRQQQTLAQREQQAQVMQMTDGFIKAHPDFANLRDSGELQRFISENPLHDSVSAYFALQLEQAKAAQEAAVAAAVKAAEEKVRKEVAAKQHAKTMTGATSAPPVAANGIDPELADPTKFGGTSAVLLKRLMARRGASA